MLVHFLPPRLHQKHSDCRYYTVTALSLYGLFHELDVTLKRNGEREMKNESLNPCPVSNFISNYLFCSHFSFPRCPCFFTASPVPRFMLNDIRFTRLLGNISKKKSRQPMTFPDWTWETDGNVCSWDTVKTSEQEPRGSILLS